jgi:membrane-associated phospholipid phosphatase
LTARRLMVALFLFALLAALALTVQSGGTTGFDRAIGSALVLRQGSSPDALIRFLQAVSWVGGGTQRYIIVLALALLLGFWHRWRSGGVLIAASVTSNMVSEGLKDWIARPRPDMVPHLDHVNSLSFPSGHAASAALVYLLFAALAPKGHRVAWFGFALLFMILTGWSRVALGVHWPSDVLGGWLLGSGFALLGVILVRWREQTAG